MIAHAEPAWDIVGGYPNYGGLRRLCNFEDPKTMLYLYSLRDLAVIIGCRA